MAVRDSEFAAVDYGEEDDAMRWLLANDPDARRMSELEYGRRHGVITKPIRDRIVTRELTAGDLLSAEE